ncbi:RsmB/NOP family class I SAM-dependent RNA methyltransferase, partial [Amylibacter sp.]|nr:RsmB/NOP family class I SAM-dependent RNA methyltransferase [Amylibacter sp.]
MTPSARYSAAIIILDRIMVGAPAERELTSWARSNRFAGSKDRAAIRDIVYDCIRNLRSYGY